MTNKTYSTSALARIAGVHPNTIRFYDNAGLLSPAPRAANGYRQFDERHVAQLKVCRLIFRSEWLHSRLRNTAFAVLDSLRVWDLPQAEVRARQYHRAVEQEYARALDTAALLRRKNWPHPQEEMRLTQAEAAQRIGVTPEALRNWERNGLLTVPREGSHHKRVYGAEQFVRLRVIYMLRQANYSIDAIARSLALYDAGNRDGAVLALNQAPRNEENPYASVGDRWLQTLLSAAEYAKEIIFIVQEAAKEDR